MIRAAQAHFEAAVPDPSRRAGMPALPLFREAGDRSVEDRVPRARREVQNRDVSERKRRSILAKHTMQVRRTNAFVADRVVITDRGRKMAGADLLDSPTTLQIWKRCAWRHLTSCPSIAERR